MFFGLVISYFQRVNLSVGMVAMTNPSPSSDFPIINYSTYEKGVLSGVFYLGYLTSGVPAGILADKYGPVRLVAIAGGLLCGLTTLAFPFAAIYSGFEAVCVTRVLQGICQGVFIPGTQAFLSKWAIPNEREKFAWVWSGTQLGTIIMMPLGGLLAESPAGWPSIFYVSGALSIVWGIFCGYYGADSPEKHKSISIEEKSFIELNFQASSKKGKNMPVPWKDIAVSGPLWALLVCQSSENWGFATFITLIPTYLQGVYDFDIAANGVWSALPYLMMFVTSYVFAYLGGHLRRHTSVNFSRKYWSSVALYGTAASVLPIAFFDINATGAIILLTLANGLDSGIYLGHLSNHLDLAPNYAGILSGITNALGNITSILSPAWAGYVVLDEHSMEQWQIVFLVTAFLKIFGNTVFIIFGSTETQPWNEPKNQQELSNGDSVCEGAV